MLRRLHSLIKGSRDVSQALDSSAAHHHPAGDHPLQLIAQPREGPVPRGLLQSGVFDHNEFHTTFPRDSSHGDEEQEEQTRTSSSINNNMPEAEEESSCESYSDTSCREKYEDAFETIDLQESSSNSVVENGKDFSRGEVSGSTNESDPAIAITMAKGVQLDEGFTAIDISKEEEEQTLGKGGGGGGGPERTISMLSLDNLECCRICQQQHTEEPLIDLGCSCRGELAKAHRSCIDMWFKNKGSNKCEVCQHVAANIPAPASQPIPHFWVWRVGGPYTIGQATSTYSTRAHFHPLWAAMLILVAGLLFDVLISIFLGASALPVNIIIGVLVVLGMGTAVRLTLECCHERIMQRNLRRLELQPMSSAYEAPLQVVTQSSDVQTQPPAQPCAQPLTRPTELGA